MAFLIRMLDGLLFRDILRRNPPHLQYGNLILLKKERIVAHNLPKQQTVMQPHQYFILVSIFKIFCSLIDHKTSSTVVRLSRMLNLGTMTGKSQDAQT